MILDTIELINQARTLDHNHTIFVRNLNNLFICGVYYQDNTCYFMFDEFDTINVDSDKLFHLLQAYDEGGFKCEILKDIPSMYYEIHQMIIHDTLEKIIDNPDSNTCEIIRHAKSLLGKPVKFSGNQVGVVVNLIRSLSDFYYGVVKPDGSFFYETCLAWTEVIPDEDISIDLQELVNNHNLLMDIRRTHVLSNTCTTDTELIHI